MPNCVCNGPAPPLPIIRTHAEKKERKELPPFPPSPSCGQIRNARHALFRSTTTCMKGVRTNEKTLFPKLKQLRASFLSEGYVMSASNIRSVSLIYFIVCPNNISLKRNRKDARMPTSLTVTEIPGKQAPVALS